MAASGCSQCKIGKRLNEECHKKYYVTKIGFIDFSSFDKESKHLVELRVHFSNNDQIYLHENVYLTRYQSLQPSCANPFSNHKKLVSSKYLSL